MNNRMASLKASVRTMLGMAPAARAPGEGEPEADPNAVPAGDPEGDKPDGDAPPAVEPDPAAEPAEADAAVLTAHVREAAAVATAAANARWQAVLAHAEAKGRLELATHLLGGTDLAAETIIASLAASPKAGAGGLQARMAGEPNPPVTAGGNGDAPPAADHQAGWNKAITTTRGAIRT